MNVNQWIAVFALVLACAAAAGSETPKAGPFGVLIMAHGGSPEWNQAVLDAVQPLRDRYPVAVAFGMADACSLQEAVRTLETAGVREVGVVRLFISGESWYETTEQILGLRAGAPAASEASCKSEHAGSHHHSMAFFRIDTPLSFALSKEGLAEAPEVGPILAERARSLSQAPQKEDVLILAHGPADDAENQRWLAHMEARATDIRQARPFRRIETMTLREDWPDKRKAAEQKIRDFVAETEREGRRTIVLPFRLAGFGPYEQVLQGLEYRADRKGLLPHDNVTRWISRQAEELRAQLSRSAG